MRTLIFVVALVACLNSFGGEDRKLVIEKEYSEYRYTVWRASDSTTTFEGMARAYSLRKAWLQIVSDVNKMAKEEDIPNGTKFTVRFSWKGKGIARTLIVNKDRPTMEEALAR